tara:strand:+ start:19452 stop:20153 length:702 start_codon:yes stop_codon:yes gene_type:complete
MNTFKKLIPTCLSLILLGASCSSDENGSEIDSVDPPTQATLLFPENNTECNEGAVISETEAEVLFQWEEATNASSYILEITNLNEGTSRNISTITNEFLIRILRGVAYSWSVKSLVSGTTDTAESSIWKFYSAGLQEESHAPFPAEAISPQSGTTVNAGSITVEWEASDVDNDIASYTLWVDTVNPPITEVGDTSNTNLGITVASGQVYYWKVVTTDQVGNTSDSQIFEFAVN